MLQCPKPIENMTSISSSAGTPGVGAREKAPPASVRKPRAKRQPAAKRASSPDDAAPRKRRKAADSIPKRKKEESGKQAPVAERPAHEAIALRAYYIAQTRVRKGLPGSPADDWLEAERQLTVEISRG